jgi:hypothetical protein
MKEAACQALKVAFETNACFWQAAAVGDRQPSDGSPTETVFVTNHGMVHYTCKVVHAVKLSTQVEKKSKAALIMQGCVRKHS